MGLKKNERVVYARLFGSLLCRAKGKAEGRKLYVLNVEKWRMDSLLGEGSLHSSDIP